jgi:uncharacterized protein (DUF1810 family)
MARFYGIGSLEEARGYRVHPILGPRLVLCTGAVLQCTVGSLHDIFGSPDDLKFRSSMTLFEAAAPEPIFAQVLDRWCAGQRDPLTLRLTSSSEAT